MDTFEQYLENTKNRNSISKLKHTKIYTDTYPDRYNDNQELIAYYHDWIKLSLINFEFQIVSKYKLKSEIKSKEELHLLKILREYKHITNLSATFKQDGTNKKLSKFKITESTKEKILSDWLNEDGCITSIKSGGITTAISRTIRGKF